MDKTEIQSLQNRNLAREKFEQQNVVSLFGIINEKMEEGREKDIITKTEKACENWLFPEYPI